jgi:hypothetical protein
MATVSFLARRRPIIIRILKVRMRRQGKARGRNLSTIKSRKYFSNVENVGV